MRPEGHLPALPSVDRLLRTAVGMELAERWGHSFVVARARTVLSALRTELQAEARLAALAAEAPEGAQVGGVALAGEGTRVGDCTHPGEVAVSADHAAQGASLLERAVQALQCQVSAELQPAQREVLNLSGTVLHTNLGRAVLAPAVLDRIAQTMHGATNLEFDLNDGSRGDRDALVESLLCELTGAEAATVVNNNAAAVLLVVSALAGGREVVVSRGELVEIGGAFRMPDVMAAAGARLVEVGTTNRTHLHDYERAIGPGTALLLKVHTSNYAITGFTSSVPERELAHIAHARGLPLATDLGSGTLVDLSRYGLTAEPTPRQHLAAGCDVVTFSGDKLLGGPQAGLIVGRRESIARIRRHPMKRALRLGKLQLVALEATLALYRHPESLERELPTLRHLSRPVEQIRGLAQSLHAGLVQAIGVAYDVEVADMPGQVGAGSLPVDRLASAGLAIRARSLQSPLPDHMPPGRIPSLSLLQELLRALPVPIVGRVAADRLLLDLRCVDEPARVQRQWPHLARLLEQALAAARR